MWQDSGTSDRFWPCRFIASVGVIEAVAATTGKPYMARITGRDATYAWKRDWLKPRWEAGDASDAIVRLVLDVRLVGSLPAALEIRWGPATGPIYTAGATANQQQVYRYCGYRGFFILSLDGFKSVQEQHVAMLIDDKPMIPGPPYVERDAGPFVPVRDLMVKPPKPSEPSRAKNIVQPDRARIAFDEEV
jgi:hypothetical protein